jgi:hypothetical protein
MSCTHDCGCTPEIRDARTDEWVQIAPESARAATLTPEQPVKAPGQGGDLLLTRGTIVEADWPNGNRSTVYVDEGGYQHIARGVGKSKPLQWLGGRIVRVLTEDKPMQEPVLPRRIEPEDVRVGMVVERRKGEAAMRDRVHLIDNALIGPTGFCLWIPEYADKGWSLWLIEDAPEPVDPDAALVEVMAEAVWRSVCGPHAQWPDGPGSPSDSDHWRESSRAAIVAARAAGYRIEAAR